MWRAETGWHCERGRVGGVDMTSEPLNIAVLGDLHGHLTLAYRLLRRWEREHEQHLDAILQVGDLGAYPPPFCLDKATLRFAQKDPDELGFEKYYSDSEEAAEILADDAPDRTGIRAHMTFIKGNHEDFEYLNSLSTPFDGPIPVDHYHKIHYLKSGSVEDLMLGEHTLRLTALGGIADNHGPGGPDPVSPFYTRAEIRRLRSVDGPVDVLLTHDVPEGAAAGISGNYANAGSRDITELIADLQPAYHFCGHYHESGQRLEDKGHTASYILNAVNFQNERRLRPGCIGILRWSGREHSAFEILDEPWLTEYTKWNFRDL